MTGYFDNPEATAAAIEHDGWLHTGDLGSMDERGSCRIGGRLKDMVIKPREPQDGPELSAAAAAAGAAALQHR